MTVNESTSSGVILEIPLTIGHYKYLRTLGSGSWSVVVEVEHVSTGEHLACKIVSRKELTETGDFRLFEQELRVHEFLHHPNIVRVHDMLFKPDLVFVFLELCTGGDLLTFILNHPGSPPGVLRPMVVQILSALNYIHSRGITHRDIKPENILLTDRFEIKLCDFGLAEVRNLPAIPSSSGTMYYAAPEVFLRPEAVSTKADMWSFAILLFALFSGRLPWEEVDRDTLIKQITNREFKATYVLPRDIFDMFERCTQIDPDARPTAAELLELPGMHEATPMKLVHSGPVGGKVLSCRATLAQKHVVISPKLQLGQVGTHLSRSRINSSLSSPLDSFGDLPKPPPRRLSSGGGQ
jgi:serine/threonine protein kinase